MQGMRQPESWEREPLERRFCHFDIQMLQFLKVSTSDACLLASRTDTGATPIIVFTFVDRARFEGMQSGRRHVCMWTQRSA